MQAREVATGVFYSNCGVPRFSRADVDELAERAMSGPSGRTVLCLHRNAERDGLHEMAYAYRKGADFPVHKHLKSDESKLVVRGAAILCLYDDDGRLTEKISMSRLEEEGTAFVRVPAGVYHYLEVASEVCVYIETKLGPFDPGDNVFGAFGPDGTKREKQ